MTTQVNSQQDPLRRARIQQGLIMLIGGFILLLGGSYLLSEVITPQSNKWLINFSPLAAFAGIVLLGQGGIMLFLKGRKLTAWFLAFPTLIFILVVVIVPTIYVFGVSFVQWDIQIPGRDFIFLDNYDTIINTARVHNAIFNTGFIAIIAVALEFVLGIGLALLFVDRFIGRSVLLSIFIIPMMMAPIVVGQTSRMIWNTRFGAINHILSVVTGSTVELQWFGKKNLAFIAIITTDVWQWTPFIFLIALAGLLAINTELYEAAAIDGANAWQIFWRITLPILRPILLVALLFRLIEALKMFDIIFVTTNGGPGRATENITLYLYEQGFQFARFGYSAAGAVLFLLVIIIISTLLVRIIGER
jgi:multiple sugar transport system permease protein